MHKSDSSPFFRSSKCKQILSSNKAREFYDKSISISKKRKSALNNLRCTNHECNEEAE